MIYFPSTLFLVPFVYFSCVSLRQLGVAAAAVVEEMGRMVQRGGGGGGRMVQRGGGRGGVGCWFQSIQYATKAGWL